MYFHPWCGILANTCLTSAVVLLSKDNSDDYVWVWGTLLVCCVLFALIAIVLFCLDDKVQV